MKKNKFIQLKSYKFIERNYYSYKSFEMIFSILELSGKRP